jgi:hypothetical protein
LSNTPYDQNRPFDVSKALGELFERVRRLEAVPAGSACECCVLGQGVELTANESITGTEIIPWDAEVVDPWDMWDAGTPSEIVIPAGLAGAYHVSIAFTQGGE